MVAVEIVAFLVGVASFVALALISVRGPRDRSARLRGNGGAIVPIGDDAGDADSK